MRHHPLFLCTLTVFALISTGCPKAPSATTATDDPKIQWVEEGIEHEGYTIALGYRKATADANEVEPVASIQRDGAPIAGAMVFVRLLKSGASDAPPAADLPTTYHAAEESDSAFYSAGPLPSGDGGTSPSVAFRIALPDVTTDFTHELSPK